jgi:hypothetical protein
MLTTRISTCASAALGLLLLYTTAAYGDPGMDGCTTRCLQKYYFLTSANLSCVEYTANPTCFYCGSNQPNGRCIDVLADSPPNCQPVQDQNKQPVSIPYNLHPPGSCSQACNLNKNGYSQAYKPVSMAPLPFTDQLYVCTTATGVVTVD